MYKPLNNKLDSVELGGEWRLDLDLPEFKLQASDPLEEQLTLKRERGGGGRRGTIADGSRRRRRLVDALLQANHQVAAELRAVRVEQRQPEGNQLWWS